MIKIEKDKNLINFNFYKLKTKTKYFLELKNKEDFSELFTWIEKKNLSLKKINKKSLKYFILGEGSNIIFLNEIYDGLVIKISNSFVKWVKNERAVGALQKPVKQQVEVGAGKNLDNFLAQCQKKNIFNIQSLSAIPGSTGAAAFGNVGAFGSEIKKFIFGVWVFNIKKNKFEFIKNKDLKFSYRYSILKGKKNFIIYSVIFDFSKNFQEKIKDLYKKDEYFSFIHFAKRHNLKNFQQENLRKEIKKIRRNIYPNIKKFPNVGSTFKNIEITKTQFKKIQKKYSKIPNWELESGKIKIPTAYIFDKVINLNGKVFGNIQIDKRRPLFFINTGKATGKEFFNLCQKIKKRINKELSIKIEEEVKFMK